MCPTSRTKYWKFFFNLKDNKYNLKKTNVVKAHKALCSYALHAQISNTRCPVRQLLTGFQSSTAWPTNTDCWHPPQPAMKTPEEKKKKLVYLRGGGTQKLKCVWSFWGDRRLVVEFGQRPNKGQARTHLGNIWFTTLSPSMAPAYHFWACFNTRLNIRVQLFLSPQLAYQSRPGVGNPLQ